ncbi:hypothetical protein E2562_001370 [Oryza meyeriana var. granulata]|uniref:Uncharacterized protein n=1 Tax=Oryza meyeriana var. granulata TaxID=110450 RepID=A0A6G1DCJ8_9ORYZ|nr:hypothetical protein E2562_001370 [Oryza meyeriana var. granulata]
MTNTGGRKRTSHAHGAAAAGATFRTTSSCTSSSGWTPIHRPLRRRLQALATRHDRQRLQVRRHPGRQADAASSSASTYYREVYPGTLRFYARSTWSPSAGQHWSDDLPVPFFVPAAPGRPDEKMKVTVWVHAEDDNGRGRGSGGSDDGEASWVLSRSFDVRELVEDAGLAHFLLECKDWEVLEARAMFGLGLQT